MMHRVVLKKFKKMVKKQQLTEFARMEIIRMVAQGKSYAEIADTVGCTKGTITYTMKRYNEHETVRDLHRSGRKRLATARDERNLINIVNKNRSKPSSEIAKEWVLSNGKKLSPRLVRKILRNLIF